MKRLVLLVCLGVLTAVATGCNLQAPAATVNGEAIAQSTVSSDIEATIANTNAECAMQIQDGLSQSPIGTGTEDDTSTPNAVTTAFAAQELEGLILQTIEEQTLAQHHAAVTSGDVSAALADYESQLTAQQSQGSVPTGCTLTTSAPLASQLPKTFLRQRAVSLADQEVFEVTVAHVDLSEAAERSYYAAHLAEVDQECLNIVVADTSSAAQALRNQIASGTSFATASTSASADAAVTPPGGEVQCVYPSEVSGQFGTALGATIDALSTGQLSEPLTWSAQSTTGGQTTYYLVVQMRARQLVPFDTLRSTIRQVLLEQHSAVVSATLRRLVARSSVTVDPRYGTWSAKQGVAVPTPPPPAFVPNPGADQASSQTALSGIGGL